MIIIAGCNTMFAFADEEEKDNSGTFCLVEKDNSKSEN